MRKFFVNAQGLPQSEDGVIIDQYFSYEMASYSMGDKRYIIPWEALRDASGSCHRFFLRSAYVDGHFGKPVPDDELAVIARDLETALVLVGTRYEMQR